MMAAVLVTIDDIYEKGLRQQSVNIFAETPNNLLQKRSARYLVIRISKFDDVEKRIKNKMINNELELSFFVCIYSMYMNIQRILVDIAFYALYSTDKCSSHGRNNTNFKDSDSYNFTTSR